MRNSRKNKKPKPDSPKMCNNSDGVGSGGARTKMVHIIPSKKWTDATGEPVPAGADLVLIESVRFVRELKEERTMALLGEFPFSEVSPAPPPLPTVTAGHKKAFAHNIANQPINDKRYALPFIANLTGDITELQWWGRYGSTGYAGGDGGTYRFSVHDPDAGGMPGVELGAIDNWHNEARPSWVANQAYAVGERFSRDGFNWEVATAIAANEFATFDAAIQARLTQGTAAAPQINSIDFTPAGISVVQGQKYWALVENIAADPFAEFRSLNGAIHRNDLGIQQFDIADPIGSELFLHVETGVGTGAYKPYVETLTDPNHVAFPLVVFRINDGGSTTWGGFGTQYGSLQAAHPTTDHLQIPAVDGPANRIRQTAVFNTAVTGAKLRFAALSELGADVEVWINGVLFDTVTIAASSYANYAWHETTATRDIAVNDSVTVEYRSTGRVMFSAAVYHPSAQPMHDYTGRAEMSTDSGANWEGWPVSSSPNHPGVQTSFYFEGT